MFLTINCKDFGEALKENNIKMASGFRITITDNHLDFT